MPLVSNNKRPLGSSAQSIATLEAPTISPGQAFTEATYQYLLRGKLAELAGNPLTVDPLELSPTQGFKIEARLGAGAEGVVYYGTLLGEGWGAGAGRDAALKVSHPFSLRDQRSLPGEIVNSDDDCALRLADFRIQTTALRLLERECHNDRQISPKLYGSFTLPLAGKDGVAVEVVALEFIEGQQLADVIIGFQHGDIDDRAVLSHIRQTALTLGQLLKRGLAYIDATTQNFIVPSPYHTASPFSIMVDLGGAILDSTLSSAEESEANRVYAIQAFSRECQEIVEGPQSDLIDSAFELLEQLENMEITLPAACDALERLVSKD